MIFKTLYKSGDRLEDKIRGKLSHYPIIYAFVGGTGVVIFWRGVWHTMDAIMEYFFGFNVSGVTSTSMFQLPWWDGLLSILIGGALLLLTGLFVTSFIGNEIILSGLKREKRMAEKTEEEIKADLKESDLIKNEMHEVNNRLKIIEDRLGK